MTVELEVPQVRELLAAPSVPSVPTVPTVPTVPASVPTVRVPLPVPIATRVLGVGTATIGRSYTQQEVLDAFAIRDPKIRSLFLNGAIERRHLVLPPPDDDGHRGPESQGQLLARHRRMAVEMGGAALLNCLDSIGASLADLRHLCCVTSTGFLTPGLSALIIRDLGIDRHCSRSDIVGMGCNAGLNAVGVVSGWASAHPGELAVVVCAEACSAAYAMDGTMRTAVVNSLFGDGAGAIALTAGLSGDALEGPDDPYAVALPSSGDAAGPEILKFASCIIPDAVDAMRYDFDDELGRFSFYLDPDIPYVVGAHAELVVDRLLAGTGLRRSDIDHWVVHSGGKKVIDAVVVNLGLPRHATRHTVGVLRDQGNVSSASFLFSYQRLLAEGVARPGDHGVLMTMGPGSTIETALIRW